jgi:hypothetical protein
LIAAGAASGSEIFAACVALPMPYSGPQDASQSEPTIQSP